MGASNRFAKADAILLDTWSKQVLSQSAYREEEEGYMLKYFKVALKTESEIITTKIRVSIILFG